MATKKAVKRRQEIIDAARTLFMERPYEAVSIGDLERATGLTRGPLYYYFAGKEEIYAAIVVDGLRMIERDIAEMAKRIPDPAAFIGALVAEQESIHQNDPALFDIHFRFFFGRQNAVQLPHATLQEVNAIIARAIDTIAQVIARAVAGKVFRCDDPHFAALSIWGMMVTTLQMDSGQERFQTVGRPRQELTTLVHRQVLALLGYSQT